MEMPSADNVANAEFFANVEQVMEQIEKMKGEVDEVKRTQSAILSSPSTDDSKFGQRSLISFNRTYT